MFFFLEDDGGVDYCVQANVSNDETAAWPVANPVVTCASVSDVVYINLALSIICFTCSSVLLYTNVITHFRCVFVFGLNVILFQVSQHMMSSMLEMERFSLCQGMLFCLDVVEAWED